ncbi:MAG: DNA mismatch repair endonuclease MutL [Victivallaceae bacterium]
MSNIRVLPENISNRIAAGEVIERPASVVKELVENAIDAGATSITVEIEHAGGKLISVTDNGSGMDQDDALMCLEPHATSKIREEHDIDLIHTLGFRGEAIPSIASISRFYLKTRTHDSREGSEIIVHGGRIVQAAPAGCAPGTQISVRDLFFNTPARKKFLRTESTEEKHIQEMLYMLALPYPEVAFELIVNGRRVFSSPAHDTLLPRIKTFFGKSYLESMLPVAYSEKGISVSGFAARHGLTRNSRREQRTFVNGRPVESAPMFRGIRDGYGSLIEKGRFAPVLLFLRVDLEMVDVNVHPAKREVRFNHENNISGAIAEAVRTALRQAPAPSVTLDSRISLKTLLQSTEINYASPKSEQPALEMDEIPDPEITEIIASAQKPATGNFSAAKPDSSTWTAPTERSASQPVSPIPTVKITDNGVPMLPGSGPISILGFLDETYILATGAAGLIVIDQHAAHERVMFEKLLKGAENNIPSQKLLLPITLEVSRAEASFLIKKADVFLRLGFEIEPLSSNTIMLSAIPHSLAQENSGGLIRDILSDMVENESLNAKTDLETIARASCIAAVKAHDSLSLEEAKSLLRQLAECDMPFSCPHGRPTLISITVRELEKRFGRK